MEPRAALGEFDAASGRYTLHAGSGGAVRQKRTDVGHIGEMAGIPQAPAQNRRGEYAHHRKETLRPGEPCG